MCLVYSSALRFLFFLSLTNLPPFSFLSTTELHPYPVSLSSSAQIVPLGDFIKLTSQYILCFQTRSQACLSSTCLRFRIERSLSKAEYTWRNKIHLTLISLSLLHKQKQHTACIFSLRIEVSV